MRQPKGAGGWCIRVGTLVLLIALWSSPTAARESINYRLKWLLNTSVAGDIYADVNGFFDGAGLDVTVKPGGPERDAIKELELGLAQFGVASADQVIRALSKGAPVVVIAQLFQVNPLQWIYRGTDPPIRELGQLKGKTIGVTFGGNDETILRTLLAKADLTEMDVTLFSVRYDYTPFYQRRVDIWPVYRNTQGIFLDRKLAAEGESVQFFNPAAFGVRFVANSVVTSKKMADENPETVGRFLKAVLRGWREAMAPENAEKTVAAVQRFDRETAEDVLQEQLTVTRGLIAPTPRTVIGTIDVAAWEQTEAIMLEQGQIDRPVGVKRVLMPAFMAAPVTP